MARNPSLAAVLRKALIAQASRYVQHNEIDLGRYYSSSRGVTIFLCYKQLNKQRHDNFHSDSYDAIISNLEWAKRLAKPHNGRRFLPDEHRSTVKELDSCCSSDALLMNIFCHPLAPTALAPLFGFKRAPRLQFGFKPRLSYSNGGCERSEIDLCMSQGRTAFCEAKLTESDFTSNSLASVHRYKYFQTIFLKNKLPQRSGQYLHYQLIRNVLAAHQHDASFYLLYDDRRPDLRVAFDAVLRAIRLPSLQSRCRSMTWQQIAAQLPQDLRKFLSQKYGIM